MVAKEDQFATVLKSAGYSMTSVRRVLFATLNRNGSLTIQQLIKSCTDIDRASIYRTITLFEKLHIAHRVYTGWKYRIELSDTFHHHHHATCEQCNQMILLHDEQNLENALQDVARKHQFEIHSHQVELVGLCAGCRLKSPTPTV